MYTLFNFFLTVIDPKPQLLNRRRNEFQLSLDVPQQPNVCFELGHPVSDRGEGSARTLGLRL